MLRTICAVLMAGTLLHAQETPPENPTGQTSQTGQTSPTTPAEPTSPAEPPKSAIAIEIDLSAQKAWVLQDGQRVYETPISTGRSGHETPAGNFTVLEKDPDHKSSLYGKLLDDRGRIIKSDADFATPVPPGAKFQPAPMKNFLRFEGAVGMHAGRLPGYPASHGCVRLPASKALLFYNIAEVGTPVRVFGKAPRTGNEPQSHPEIVKVTATPAPAPVEQKRGLFWFLKRDRGAATSAPAPQIH